MTLQKKVKCEYHGDGILAEMHPEYVQHPFLCPWCHGKLEHELSVHLYYYDGKFSGVDWDKISDYQDDIWCRFECECGDEISVSDSGDAVVCKCGRIYRLDFSLKVDETHIGEIDWLIAESNKRE